MAYILKKNDVLWHLNLSNNMLEDSTGHKFEMALDSNKTLIYLNLENNLIKSSFVTKIK